MSIICLQWEKLEREQLDMTAARQGLLATHLYQ
jgi:hypothetical protein